MSRAGLSKNRHNCLKKHKPPCEWLPIERGQVLINDYRRWGEEVVLLDIETGAEQGRVRVGGITQGVVFPSVGWNGDVYWSSMGRFSRVFAA